MWRGWGGQFQEARGWCLLKNRVPSVQALPDAGRLLPVITVKTRLSVGRTKRESLDSGHPRRLCIFNLYCGDEIVEESQELTLPHSNGFTIAVTAVCPECR